MHKISIGSWAFAFGPFTRDPWELPKVLQWTKDAGYDGIELNGFRPHPHHDDYDTAEKCGRLVREVEAYGISISGYAPDLTAVPPAVVDSGTYLKELRKCLFFCGHSGIRILRVDSVSPPDILEPQVYEERFARLVRTWQTAAAEAAKAGVKIVWEFEPGFWLNKPSEVKRLLEAVNHPHFQVLFDSSHAYMGAVIGARHTGGKEILSGGVIEYAALLAEHIGYVHVIDSDGTLHNGETSTHVHFGKGAVDFPALMRAIRPELKQLDWIGVDYCFNENVIHDGKQAVPLIRQYMKEANV